MTAPKRGQRRTMLGANESAHRRLPATAEGLRGNAELLAAQDPDISAKLAAIMSKQKPGGGSEGVANGLAYLAMMAVLSRKRMSRGQYERMMFGSAAKTRKALKDFPARLRCLAKEMDDVNQWGYGKGGEAFGDCGQSLRAGEIPTILKGYADMLQTFLTHPPQELQELLSSARRKHNPSWIARLSRCVEDFTGAFLDRQVVDLLQAFAYALDVDVVFDTQTLANIRQEEKRKPT